MGRECSTYGIQDKCSWQENLKERIELGTFRPGWHMAIGWTLEKSDGSLLVRFSWLKAGTCGGLLEIW